MNPQSSFRRKIVYLVIIVGLLMLLSLLGRPGGILAQRREAYGLSQTQLGEIDPTSETLKLATLGMRGVAANILWGKANSYKMKKDWNNLSATLEQITKLQPNFISVWRFQAWNLSYNVSVEFDDFHERYRWVIRGINFLKEGIRYNQHEPQLVWDVGFFICQKIGRSDERRQFRRLFKQDDEFHGARAIPLRDNWLVGKEWFLRAEELADSPESNRIRMNPLIFRSNAPMCQMSYSEGLEKDGTFGETAKREWQKAAEEWRLYGDQAIVTSYGIAIRLNDKEKRDREIQDVIAQLEAIEPGLKERIVEEKRAQLTDEQREALDTEPKERTAEQYTTAIVAEQLIKVTHEDLAPKITGPKRPQAVKLAKQARASRQMADVIARYRHVVNFDYWGLRAQVEQDDETINARKLTYQADQASADADLEAARDAYEGGLKGWRKVLDKYPEILIQRSFGDDLMDVIDAYRQLLHKLDDQEKLEEIRGKDFILRDVIDMHQVEQP